MCEIDFDKYLITAPREGYRQEGTDKTTGHVFCSMKESRPVSCRDVRDASWISILASRDSRQVAFKHENDELFSKINMEGEVTAVYNHRRHSGLRE